MIKLKNLTIKNFLSIGSVTQALNLDLAGMTLILGENLDAGIEGSRNGAGKSAILNAVSYGLFGSPLTNIKKDNLINKINSKNMVVSIEFEKNGHNYRIERGRKPNFIKYIVDDNLVTSPDTDESQGESKWTQDEIDRTLGINHLMFKHLVGLNTYTEPFLSMKASDQRNLIEEILSITLLSRKSEDLKELIKDTKEKIKEEEILLKSNTESNNRIQKSIDELNLKSKIWQKKKDENLLSIKKQLESFASIDFSKELESLDQLEIWIEKNNNISNVLDYSGNRLKLLKQEYSNFENEHVRIVSLKENKNIKNKERFLVDISRKESLFQDNFNKIQNEEKHLNDLKTQLDSPESVLCKLCNQTLKDDDHREKILVKIKNDYDKTFGLIENLKNSNILIQTEIDQINREMILFEKEEESGRIELEEKEKEILEKINSQSRKIFEKEKELKEKEKELSFLGEKPKSIFLSRKELFDSQQIYEKLKNDILHEESLNNPYLEQIEILKNSLYTIDYSLINELTRLKDHQEFLLKLLTSKDSFIRKKIIDQNLSYLNHRLAFYLEKLNLSHTVKFLNDLSVEITRLGKDFDFDNLSRGERNRLILALNWSFRDIWESLNSSINLMFVDEMLDSGLDLHGSESALSILKDMARTRSKNIFLISHKEELISRVSNILLIRKEDGFSTISDYE